MRRPFVLALLLAAPPVAAQSPDLVTMGLDDFLRLYEQSRSRPPAPVAPPRAHSVAVMDLDGEIIDEGGSPLSARFTARARVVVHGDGGWVRVPLLSDRVALESATLNGRPAPVVLEGDGYTLVTDQGGELDLRLTFVAPIRTEAGRSGFSFPLMPAGASTLRLRLPSADPVELTVANAGAQQEQIVGGRRVVTASLPPRGALDVRWQRDTQGDAAAVAREPRIYSEVTTLVGLGDGVLTATATVRSNILFAGVDQLQLQLPTGVTLLDLSGDGVQDWSVDGAQRLTVKLAYAAEQAHTLRLRMEQVVVPGEVLAPLVVPLGVERTKGWVGVESRGTVEVGAGEVQGATPVDVRGLPADILGLTSNPVLLGFKYLGADARLPLWVSQHEEADVLVTLLDQAEATTMFTRDGRRLTSVRYEVRNNRRQFLRLRLPEGAELWSVAVGEKAVQPARSGEDLLIPLVRSAASGGALASFGVEVVYVEAGAPPDAAGRGAFEARLPAADAPTTWVGWTIYAPDDAKVRARRATGSLHAVPGLSRPLGAVDVLLSGPAAQLQVQDQARAQAAGGGMGEGAAPVRVRLPLEGVPYAFEKVLALDEELWLKVPYSGL